MKQLTLITLYSGIFTELKIGTNRKPLIINCEILYSCAVRLSDYHFSLLMNSIKSF